jgi:cytochrome b subunit of formate dehydrogenase
MASGDVIPLREVSDMQTENKSGTKLWLWLLVAAVVVAVIIGLIVAYHGGGGSGGGGGY